MKQAGRLIARDTIGKRPTPSRIRSGKATPGIEPGITPGPSPPMAGQTAPPPTTTGQCPGLARDLAAAEQAYLSAFALNLGTGMPLHNLALRANPPQSAPRQMPRQQADTPDPARASEAPRPRRPRAAAGAAPSPRGPAPPLIRWRSPGDPRTALALPGSAAGCCSPCAPCGCRPPCRGRAVAGASERDWLLVIEADGLHRDEDLNLQPLLRQFAVGRVSIQRVSAQSRSLTAGRSPAPARYQPAPGALPAPFGADLTPSPGGADTFLDGTLMPAQDPVFSPVELQAGCSMRGISTPASPSSMS